MQQFLALFRFQVLVDFEGQEATPCSVKFTADGRYVAIGMSDGALKLYDLTKDACVRTIRVQRTRIGCLEWSPDPGVLTCGTKIGRVYNHDVRIFDHHIGYALCHIPCRTGTDEPHVVPYGVKRYCAEALNTVRNGTLRH